jgi:hypothetical protein
MERSEIRERESGGEKERRERKRKEKRIRRNEL